MPTPLSTVDLQRLPTIVSAQTRIAAGTLRPIDLVEACLDRIREVDDQLQAWVIVNEKQALHAAECYTARAAQGDLVGPLHGIPVGVKDIIDVAGLPTLAGSRLREGHVAQSDAPVVARLRAAGAVILGKTVTTAWACFDPSPTRNPWNHDHTPGGSSSGSAAAVAAGMCMAALGTQTGGSIIRPASYCGISGMKPTFGTLSTDGIVPVSRSLDHVGPLAKTADDLARLWQVLNPAATRARGELATMLDSPPRIGGICDFFYQLASEAVVDSLSQCFTQLENAGAETEIVGLPPRFAEVAQAHYEIMAHEAAVVHRELGFHVYPDDYPPHARQLIEAGQSLGRDAHRDALQVQSELRTAWLRWIPDNVDVLAMPSTDTTAPRDLNTTGSPRFNSPWSLVGWPSLTIACGVAPDGMPVGLQIVARPGEEQKLLRTAIWCESTLAASAHA